VRLKGCSLIFVNRILRNIVTLWFPYVCINMRRGLSRYRMRNDSDGCGSTKCGPSIPPATGNHVQLRGLASTRTSLQASYQRIGSPGLYQFSSVRWLPCLHTNPHAQSMSVMPKPDPTPTFLREPIQRKKYQPSWLIHCHINPTRLALSLVNIG
jgi:hypothetical protein